MPDGINKRQWSYIDDVVIVIFALLAGLSIRQAYLWGVYEGQQNPGYMAASNTFWVLLILFILSLLYILTRFFYLRRQASKRIVVKV